MAVYVICPHDHWPSRPCQPRKPLQPVALQLRRSHILQPGTSVPGTLTHRDHAPIGRNLAVTKRKRPRWLRIWPLSMPATTEVYRERSRTAPTHFRVQYNRPGNGGGEMEDVEFRIEVHCP